MGHLEKCAFETNAATAQIGIRPYKVIYDDYQNVMKLEVFILGGQIIDQKRKKGWWRGRRERIEKGSRERIGIERKETKVN